MSDITSSKPGRTYPLPKTVIEEAQQGLRWKQAYDSQVRETARWMATFLASGGSITADVVGILASIAGTASHPQHWGKVTDEDYPNDSRVEAAMMGGSAFTKWTDKIMAAVQRESESALTASLEMMDWDPELTYLGIMDADDDCVVRSLVRVGENSAQWEKWTAEKSWEPVPFNDIRRYEAVELDRELAGVTASALIETQGLLLMFAEPVAWLPYAMVATALEDDVAPGAHYYAVVDATDNTAVMDVITISPGPVVKVRDNGAWEDGAKTLALLRGINPPPLVELDKDQLEMVLAQVDGTITAAETNPEFVESLGHEDEIVAERQKAEQEKQEEYARRQSATPVTASIAAGFEAALRSGSWESHRSVTESALMAINDMRTQEAALETLTNATLIAAGGADRNRGGAESLRRYWLYGKGAVKIKWGTAGDWTRCYRYLSKYLGTRAKGYCQLRHKEATGVYAGSKANVGVRASVEPRDGDGDGFVYDGTPQQRPARPIKVRLPRHKTVGFSLDGHIQRNGYLTPERAQLHRDIIDQLLGDVQPNPQGKQFFFMGGGTASGKSSMIKHLDNFPQAGEAVFIDSDHVKTLLPEYQDKLAQGSPDAAMHVHAESLMIAAIARQKAMRRGLDVVLDGTGAGSPGTVIGKINEAKNDGYRTVAAYANVPVAVAIARSEARGKKTGRFVPHSIIRVRHASVSSTFETVAPNFDDMSLFDTTNKPPRLIFRIVNGHREILDQDAYRAFLAKGR